MDAVEQDLHNFSTSSSHRLPTISGTQAIRNARRNAQPIPTSLPLLDDILGQASSTTLSAVGGIQRGVVTEIFGPPGVGKTTFALQIAVNVLHQNSAERKSVTWIDTSSQLLTSRLEQISHGYRLPPGHDPASSPPLPQCSREALLAEGFNYLQITKLSNLLSLFLYPAPNFPPPNTHVVVLDDLSNLILSSLPRSARLTNSQTPQKAPSRIQDAALTKRILSRRFQVLSSFALSLQKFAATNNVAVLVTSKATVNLKAGQRAILQPALISQQWDNYLSVRIALYRDFWPEEHPDTQNSEHLETHCLTAIEKRTLRFARVVRLGGKLVSSSEVGFVIDERGLRQVAANVHDADTSVLPLSTQPLHPLEDVLNPEMGEMEEPMDALDELENIHVTPTLETNPPEGPGKSKRKAIEIDDSENESEGVDDSDDDVSLPPQASPKIDFRPSSQVYQEHSQSQREESASAKKKLRAKPVSENDEDEEMLLEVYEKQIPPFSQAAIEMSEPLTPSDDGRDLS